MTTAFAYVHDNGAIEIATVSLTEQGSQVNALFFLSRGAIHPRNDWTPAMIAAAYRDMFQGRGHIAKVSISVKLDA